MTCGKASKSQDIDLRITTPRQYQHFRSRHRDDYNIIVWEFSSTKVGIIDTVQATLTLIQILVIVVADGQG